jgi:hypothetical protein
MSTPIEDATMSCNSNSQPATTLQFINIAKPTDAADIQKKSKIRSHAAKQGCLRKRQSNLEIRPYQPATSLAPSNSTDTKRIDHPDLDHGAEGTTRDTITQMWPFNLRHVMVYSRMNPFESYPRKLNDIEHFLIDHCELL